MELGGERRGCGQKSANVHAKNVSKIFLLEVTLLPRLFLLVVIDHLGACEEYGRLSLCDCQKMKGKSLFYSPYSLCLLNL